jgi:hypothetical protein
VGRNNWQDFIDTVMTKSGNSWTYTYSTPDGTEQINCCFQDGAGTWDNHNSADWAVGVSGCADMSRTIRLMPGSPSLTGDPAGQNNVGENFDLSFSGGYATTSNQNGFGSFGQVYVNYDQYNFYVGGVGLDMVGTNNAMVVFLEFSTLADNATNLWYLHGLPNSLEQLHNVIFAKPMDLAIVLGNEWGDGLYTNFNMGDGYNMGQGTYYLSTGSSSFWPMAGATLDQFDGTGTTATATTDDDSDYLTDRWECSIPWNSLGASTNGINAITNCRVAGLIISSSTNGNDRYISGNYLGVTASPFTNGNYGFNMIYLTPIEVGMPSADSDGDGIPDSWERQYFSSLSIMAANYDYDGDGARDRDEYLAGTNPKDAQSCFSATGVSNDSGVVDRFVIRWQSISSKTYELFKSTNLMTGFDPLTSGIPATPPENTYTDSVQGTEYRFYRVRTHE